MAVEKETAPELPDRPSFQEAFVAARAEHSKPAAEGETAVVETDDEGDEHAAGDEASTDGKADKAKSPSRTAGTATAATADQADTEALLTDEEFSALQTKHADDPTALRKELESAFTKKTQKLSEQKRSVERLSQYADIIDAYEADPEATIRALAKEIGMTSLEAKAAVEAATDAGKESTTTEERAKALTDKFREQLGPELDYLADALAPAILGLVEEAARPIVAAEVDPLRKGTERLLSESAVKATDGIMATFGETHPDWKSHEDAMFELSQRVLPSKGMTELEYLDVLYKAVTHDTDAKSLEKRVADGVAKVLEKQRKGAEGNERRPRTTNEDVVKGGPPEGRAPTFSEAAAAAVRGERWN